MPCRSYGIVLLVTLTALGACRRSQPSSTAPTVDAGSDLPEAFVFGHDSEQLLFSALDEQGRAVTVERVEQIPEPLRQRVMVVDLSKSPAERRADRFVFFADLTAPDEQGRFTARPMSRYRPQRGAAAAAATALADSSAQVVLYSTPWCGYCRKAKAYLKQRGVDFVERDVEASAAAARELEAKLRAARASGSGVPVIDVAGTLIMGFDKAQLDQALAQLARRPEDAGTR